MPEVKPFVPTTATMAEFEAVTELQNRFTAEAKPDDPPSTVENMRNQLLNIPPVFEFHGWGAWFDRDLVGFATLGIPHTETNQHLAQFDITVQPEWRRQGIASSFLPDIVETARNTNRSLFISNTHSTVPVGRMFMEGLGGNVGLSMRRNDLLIADLDRNLIKTWMDRAAERAAGFELIEFRGPYPEEELPKISSMQLAINNMPTDNLDIEDFEFTPDHLKQIDDSMVAQGNDRWSLIAREKATGNYAGWTDITFNPSKPNVADVGGTAVAKEYQNLGLGRWLKAQILDELVNERPEIKSVRTGNAHSNAPMLKINDELGFKPALTIDLWQIEVDKVQEYLTRRNVPVHA